MTTYTIYFLDDQKVIVSFDFVDCDTDHEAWAYVPKVLQFRTDSRNVEIYDGARHVLPPEGAEFQTYQAGPTVILPAQ